MIQTNNTKRLSIFFSKNKVLSENIHIQYLDIQSFVALKTGVIRLLLFLQNLKKT